jgi:hypothetical protein
MMEAITRRAALAVAAGAGAALLGAEQGSVAHAKHSSELAEAVRAFNARADHDAIGRTQPPLTVDEVVAAIRWACSARSEQGVTDAEYDALAKIAETRTMPPGAELEVLTGFEPDGRVVITAWSVRMRMPHGEFGGSYAFPVREQMIHSRVIGPEELKVIRKWEKKERDQGGIGSFQRAEYREERRRAMEIDQVRTK